MVYLEQPIALYTLYWLTFPILMMCAIGKVLVVYLIDKKHAFIIIFQAIFQVVAWLGDVKMDWLRGSTIMPCMMDSS